MTESLPSVGGYAVTLSSAGGAASSTPHLRDQEWNAFIGIVTAIVGNVVISFALNLQRYAHIRLNRNKLRRLQSWKSGTSKGSRRLSAEGNRADSRGGVQPGPNGGRWNEDTETSSPRGPSPSGASHDGADEKEQSGPSKNYLKSPLWWIGISLMAIGEAGNFLAYGFAPASIVSPLGVVAIISNCVIAPFLLRERFRQRDFWGILIAIGGVVTVVLSAKSQENRMGPDEIWDAITRWEFMLYLGLTTGSIVLLVWLSSKYGDRTVLIDVGLVALFGGYTALSTKGVASLLSTTLWRATTFPITYLLAFILVGTALMQIRYLNKALQRFASTQVIPTQFVLFTISVILGSAVLYRDFESATAERVGKFVGGCALTFVGVYFITSGRSDGDEDAGADDAGGAEEGIHLMQDERRPSAARPTSANGFGASGPSKPSIASRRSSNYGTLAQSRPRSPEDADADAGRLDGGESSTTLTPTKPPLPKSSSTPAATRDGTDGEPTLARGDPTPRTRPGPSPVALKTHRSISRLVPGPLSSPLSSPLSGIVVDRLRRGLDSPSRAVRNARLPSSLRRWRSDRHQDGEGDGEEGGADPLAENPTPSGASSSLRAQMGPEDASRRPASGERRTRSVSEALGSIFRVRRDQESPSRDDG